MNAGYAKAWSTLTLAGSLSLTLLACAPNGAYRPHLAADRSAAEQEDSRYGMLLRLADSTRTAGDPSASVQIYQQAITLDRERPEAYVLLGETMIELGAYDRAAQIFEQALAKDEANLAARRGYGRAMIALNRPESAILSYQKARKAQPLDIPSLNGLGVAHDLAGRHAEAQAIYEEGLKIAPDSVVLRNNLGLSLSLDGRHQEAIRLLRAVSDEPGAGARHRQNLALAYGLAGNLAAAERISRLDHDDTTVRNNVAYFAALAGLDDARKRAAALGAHAPAPKTKIEAAGHVDKRLEALALEGSGLELGLAPTGRWFVKLGDYGSSSAANAAWRRLRTQNPDLLAPLSRMASADPGTQPLLVGPIQSSSQALDLCAQLRQRNQSCAPLAL